MQTFIGNIHPSEPPNHFKDTILVIYVGGTFGMIWSSERGYFPAPPGYLYDKLSRIELVNDKSYLKELGASPESIPSPLPLQSHHASMSPLMVTPKSSVLKSRIMYRILEYTPLLDSSNMSIEDWERLASDIGYFYDHYKAFIIIHGTDTLAYTSSALSFMLSNLGKTVIITGSQIPISEFRSDALNNLVGSLTLAGGYHIPEVCVFFNGKLVRGNRVTKVSTVDYGAFESFNMKPLAEVGLNIIINYNDVFYPNKQSIFKVWSTMNKNIVHIRLFPGIPLYFVENALRFPTRGVVLESFGMGNGPSNRKDLDKVFIDAYKQGIVIVNVSQSRKNTITNVQIYETGRHFESLGILPGHDLTIESALCKLSYLLGKIPDCNKCVRRLMTTNLRGETNVQKQEADGSVEHCTCQKDTSGECEERSPEMFSIDQKDSIDYQMKESIDHELQDVISSELDPHSKTRRYSDQFFSWNSGSNYGPSNDLNYLFHSLKGREQDLLWPILIKYGLIYGDIKPITRYEDHLYEEGGECLPRLAQMVDTNTGQSLLHMASKLCKSPKVTRIIQHLLERGVSLDVVDSEGKTATDVARECGNKHAVEAFESWKRAH